MQYSNNFRKQKQILLFSFLILISITLVFCSNTNESSNHSKNSIIINSDSIKNVLQERLKILIKDKELYDIIKIENNKILIYNPLNADQPETTIYFEEINYIQNTFKKLSNQEIVEFYKNKSNNKIDEKHYSFVIKSNSKIDIKAKKPLTCIKIAIDPGHIAGSYKEAKIEWRAIEFTNGIQLYESELTYFTAYFLKDTLQKLGAEVIMTRKKHGLTAFNKTYSDWLENDFKQSVEQDFKNKNIDSTFKDFLLNKANKISIFHNYFKRKDIFERAKIINNFKPDITIIIHFNVAQWDNNSKIWQPVRENYTMSFIPGAFLKNELDSLESRAYFLRLLLSDNYSKSIELSNQINKFFKQNLNIPTVSENNKLDYLTENCNLIKYEGIYSRSLLLSQLLKSPICYSEALCQDNIIEYELLSKNDIEIEGRKTSSRLKKIAGKK